MALEAYCASCTYLGERCDSYGNYWCERKGQDMSAAAPKCYNWCKAYSRSDYARQNMFDRSRSSQSGGGCYLTTAMCTILKLPDDNHYLQTLRRFRDNVLKKDINYLSLLVAYDVIGPMIAYSLNQDKDRLEIATSLFNNFIVRAVDAIENNKNQEAINIYVSMTTSLAERYNINTALLYIDPKNINLEIIDTENLGHGRSKVRKLI